PRRTDGRSGDAAVGTPVRGVARAGCGAHPLRAGVRAAGGLPILGPSPPAAPRLAPQSRAHPGGRRAGGGAVSAVAEPVLPTGRRLAGGAVPAPAGVRSGDGG